MFDDGIGAPDMTRRHSAAASEAIDEYLRYCSPEVSANVMARTARTIGVLAAYGPRNLSEKVFDVAALMPLGDQLQIPNEHARYVAAGMGILAYFTSRNNFNTHQQNGFVGTLMGDMPHLATLANGFQPRLDRYRDQLGLTEDSGITAEDWRSLRVGANVTNLAIACQQNNIESILARASYIGDRVTHPRDNELDLFREISRIETFYAPLLEIFGLHAFDMMMRSNVDKIRFVKSGDLESLDQARGVLEEAKKIAIEDVFEQFFGVKPEEHIFSTSANSLFDENVIYSSTDIADLGSSVDNGEVRSRFKGVGNYARKIIENPEYDLSPLSANKPMDVFGMLAVLPDDGAVGKMFGDVVERARQNDRVQLTPAGKKWSPLYIQGSRKFVHSVVAQLPDEIVNMAQVRVEDCASSEVYQVAKFTCFMKFGNYYLPVEFQFQTEEDRVNARLGKLSHMNYHSGNGIGSIIPGGKDDLKVINARKTRIDKGGEFVNGQSVGHGEEFMRTLHRAMDAEKKFSAGSL